MVPAFEPSDSYVREAARVARKQRSGTLASGITDVPHRTAIEQLRTRLLNVAHIELQRIEEKQRGRKVRTDAEYLRQIARAVREAAAIPTPSDPTPPAPGQKDPKTNRNAGGPTVGGIGGRILAEHRKGPNPEPLTQKQAWEQGEQAEATGAQHNTSASTKAQDNKEAETHVGVGVGAAWGVPDAG